MSCVYLLMFFYKVGLMSDLLLFTPGTRHTPPPFSFFAPMTFQVIATGSTGNCYTLTSSRGEILLIEAGIRWQNIQKAIGYRLGDVQGVIVSHRHGDHAQALKKCQEAGHHTYANRDTIESKRGLISHYTHEITGASFWVGGYYVTPLKVTHDVPCYAFVITHRELQNRRIVFATDCVTFPYRVQNVALFAIECNYDDNTLQFAIDEGISHPQERHRLECSHMELQQTIKAINLQKEASHDTLHTALLIHASSRHATPTEMINEVERATGIPTYLAKPKQIYDV